MGKTIRLTRTVIDLSKTWDDIRCWGDILDRGRKNIIRTVLGGVPKERLCPYLTSIVEQGQVEWVYCQKKCDEYKTRGEEESAIPTFSDPRYQADIDYAFLQFFCAD